MYDEIKTEEGFEGDDALDETSNEVRIAARRMRLAEVEGDISHLLQEVDLANIGADVVQDYERDKIARKDWADRAMEAVKTSAQKGKTDKDWPWPKASNVKYPLLTVAALQFNARAYPAVVKGDEAVHIKIVGKDEGRPNIVNTPQGQIPVAMLNQMMGEPTLGADGQPLPEWIVPPGHKKQRAARVKEYMNTHIFYRMDNWGEETDHLLMLLPVIGCMFRKVYWMDGRCKVGLVSGLKIIAPTWARDCETAPRLTEEIDNLATYEVEDRINRGIYRPVSLNRVDDDEQKPRMLLEQHRFMDLDQDGLSEPYIVTVDCETRSVLRIEANFGPEEVQELPIRKRSCFYVKYDFLPNPEGEFYGYGFGHLLPEITNIIDSLTNQMIDAGTAQIAGGGFVASGIRLQGKGGGVVSFRPGEYKTVDVPGAVLRDGMVERTFPNVSPVSFQLLDMMLMAAKDITSVKDVVTGEASNQGQVGTTLALIEQSLAQFTASYKRVFNSLRKEFTLIFQCLSRHGSEKAAQDYATILDDPAADFAADFAGDDFDIRPISDPTSVTKQQKLARAQFLMQFIGNGLNDLAIMRRVLEAADIEDIDELMPQEASAPDPKMIADVRKTEAEAAVKEEDAKAKSLENTIATMGLGAITGELDDNNERGFPGMEGVASDAMDYAGA